MAKTLYFVFLFLLVLLPFCGCAINRGEQIADQVACKIEDTTVISSMATMFFIDNNKWPDSIETLRLFADKKKEHCLQLDWQKYSNAAFEILPDGQLKIGLRSVMYSKGTQYGMYDVTFTLPKPVTKAEAESLAWEKLKASEQGEINRYHIETMDRSEGSWHILFRGVDTSVSGGEFSVIVNDDRTVKVLQGE